MEKRYSKWTPPKGIALSPEFVDLFAGKSPKQVIREQDANREIFPSKAARHEIATASKDLAEFIQKHKVEYLICVDRSARPMYIGIIEYLRIMYPDAPRPQVYFLNPKGFFSQESSTDTQRDHMHERSTKNLDQKEPRDGMRPTKPIIDEFQQSAQQLLQNKEKRGLLLDTCIHTGITIAPLVETLRIMGFNENLLITTVTNSDRGAAVTADAYLHESSPDRTCLPFGPDMLVEKIFDSIYSRPNPSMRAQAHSRHLRRQIRKIIHEYYGKSDSP